MHREFTRDVFYGLVSELDKAYLIYKKNDYSDEQAVANAIAAIQHRVFTLGRGWADSKNISLAFVEDKAV